MDLILFFNKTKITNFIYCAFIIWDSFSNGSFSASFSLIGLIGYFFGRMEVLLDLVLFG